MYYYDTRHRNCNLPCEGWLFPCINCEIITSCFNTDITPGFFKKKITVPICPKCKKKNINYVLDTSLIKKN